MTTASQLFALVHKQEGRLTSELAAMVGKCPSNVSSSLRDMQKNGWIVSRMERRIGSSGAPFFARWYLTEKGRTVPYPALPYMDTPAKIKAVLGESAVPVEHVAERVGRSYHTIRSAILRMERRREVETYTEGGVLYVRWPLAPLDDDEAWTPQPWVSSIRARALGLPSAMRRVA